MSWNKVFDTFIDIKKEIGNEFTLDIPFKLLIDTYCSDYHKQLCEPLELNQYNELLLIRYGRYSNVFNGESEYDYNDFWDLHDGFYQECRSLVINLIKEEIVLCPFKKFRNLNECEENNLENIQSKIKQAHNIEITNKLDGSMQCARWYDNKVVMAGSQALDINNSWRLKDGYNRLTNDSNYVKMLQDNPNYTFIFEYISLEDAHVVIYTKEQEGLYLIGIRDCANGKQLSYKQVIDCANRYNILTTELYNQDFGTILNTLNKYKSCDKEGYVLNIDGYMVKIKCDDYVNIHRILSNISSINLIIKNIADGTFDDLISKVPQVYKDRVFKISNIVYNYIIQTDVTVESYYYDAPKSSKKEFMIWVDNNVPHEYKGYVRGIYLGKEVNYLKSGNKNCPNYKKLKDMGVSDNYSELFKGLDDE